MQAHPKKIWSVVYLQASRRCLKPQYCCTTTTSTLRKKFSYAGSRSTKTSYSTSPMSCSNFELHMLTTHFFHSNIFIENSLYWTICKENEQDFSRNLSLLLVALWAGEKQGAGKRMSLSIPFSYLIFFGLPLETGSLTPIHTLLNIWFWKLAVVIWFFSLFW